MSSLKKDADQIEELVVYGASYSDIIDWLEKRDKRVFGDRQVSAIRTLEKMNYTYDGSEFWKPPMAW